MESVRRNFLKLAGGGATVAALGGVIGFGYIRRSYARESLRADLTHDATALLANKATKELDDLPLKACEEIHTYFDGKCLNVNAFVSEVCGTFFGEKLGACASDDQKHRLLNIAFTQKVVSGIEILNRVETIAKESGAQIDQNWSHCCSQIEQAWNTSLSKSGSAKQKLDVSLLLEPMILAELERAKSAAYPLGQRPTVSGTLKDIGQDAILLLPLIDFGPSIYLPALVAGALVHLWQWLLGQLSNQAADIQTSISEQLAFLGRRVGANCQEEFRKRIADLQTFQEKSLYELAARTSEETISSLF